MNDQDSRRHRKSALDTLNDIYTTASRVRQGAQIAGMLAANFWIVIGVAVVLTIFVFILTFTGGEAAGIGGDINSQTDAKFTPPTTASDCPIPNGQITCGSKNNPINGPLGRCGHCGVGYEGSMAECNSYYSRGSRAIDYSMDIDGEDNQPIYLPKIDGHTVEWTFKEQSAGGSGSIQKYTGLDTVSKDQYVIEFHHTTIGSGNPGKHSSGELAGRINPDKNSHIHIELSGGSPSNQVSYLDATSYFCKK